ncbi:acyl-[acyl-carrier-protein]--UDP-N-acetylglucosamine O-acyltransferase [Alphaproteobacteria bacterium]|nr:acyl-[acyl-carrier-protein]--UDP-N-acetylglucosamine O-acyltransferase [Alphaproteobacteria bacterium]
MISKSAVIHSTAIVADGAVIGENCFIGPYCCVGQNVVLGEAVRLESHVVVTGDTKISSGCVIFPFASLGQSPQDLKYENERSRLEIGRNTVIREYVTANIGTQGGGMLTKIGDNCLIMAYCHVAHDCYIGDNVILVNGVNLSGHVCIGDHAIIGGMSAVKQFIRIGAHAIIGGASAIDRDVIPFGLVRSNRVTTIFGINLIGLKRRGFSVSDIEEVQSAYAEIFKNKSPKHSLTKNVEHVKKKYAKSKNVMEITDFIEEKSKNPICTTTPTDVAEP